MSFLHTFNLDRLTNEFKTILQFNADIHHRKTAIQEKLAQLKTIYTDLIKTNNKKIFLFCLDSFYFQYKILNMEMENITKMIVVVNNRMYGDYYKLLNVILIQNNEAQVDLKAHASNNKKYPVYKDLEPMHEYQTSDMMDIHEEILNLINVLHTHHSGKEHNICKYNETANIGLSISNFIHTLEYENTLLKEQISLYTSYVSFFHISQKGYLSNLHSKLIKFQKEIEENIDMNSTQPNHSANKISVKEPLDDFMQFFELTVDTTIENIILEGDSVVEQSKIVAQSLEEEEETTVTTI